MYAQKADQSTWCCEWNSRTYQRALRYQMFRKALRNHIFHCSYPLGMLNIYLRVLKVRQAGRHPGADQGCEAPPRRPDA